MNAKAKKALSVLVAGGKFVKKLETNYHGRLQFVTRLVNSSGQVVKGHGFASLNAVRFATRHEISSAGTYEEWVFATPQDPARAVELDQALQCL